MSIVITDKYYARMKYTTDLVLMFGMRTLTFLCRKLNKFEIESIFLIYLLWSCSSHIVLLIIQNRPAISYDSTSILPILTILVLGDDCDMA